MLIKALAAGIIGGIAIDRGVYLPPESLPLFGVIFGVYGVMMAWELRVLLARRPRAVGSRHARRHRVLATPIPAPARRLRPAQTRSSTA